MPITIKDVGVIGFDDWEWASLLDPPITVIAQPTYKIGKKAASLLIKRIKGEKNEEADGGYLPALAN